MSYLSQINLKRVLITIGLLVVILPVLTFAGNKNKVFVDVKASGTQNGTHAHPYKTISQALTNANSNTRIYLANGTYKENITLPSGAEIYGSNGKSKVTIEGRSHSKPVITLKGGAKIVGLTIQGGSDGVRTDHDGIVKIIKCRIRKANDNGVEIKKDGTSKDDRVEITETKIEDNDGNGVYAEKRKVNITDSYIANNGSDGVSFESGVKGWISHTNFESNDGSGLKAKLDKSSIFTKSNTYRKNDKAGIEIVASGNSGRIDIKKSTIKNNKNYGIYRVARGTVAKSIWNGLTVQKDVTFSGNKKGNTSDIFNFEN